MTLLIILYHTQIVDNQ